MKTSIRNFSRLLISIFSMGFAASSVLAQRTNPLHPPREVHIPEPPMEPTVSMRSINSGAPDPGCILSDAELKQVTAVLDKLPAGKAEDGVGIKAPFGHYTGMTLGMRDAVNKDQYTYIVVYRDYVVVRQFSIASWKPTSAKIYKHDKTRVIEKMLARLIDERAIVPEAVYEQIESNLDVRKR